MTSHSLVDGSFTIERELAVPVEKVWAAFADQQMKERWFKGPTDQIASEHTMDFREGGHESNAGIFHDGVAHRFEATYYDILPNERIIYTYEMYLNGKRISVSLAVVTFTPTATGTRLTLDEKGVFVDGFDKPEVRERGTHELLDQLTKSLME